VTTTSGVEELPHSNRSVLRHKFITIKCNLEEVQVAKALRYKPLQYKYCIRYRTKGPDSSVGVATRYGLDGPGIESRWSEIFRTCPDRPWGPPSLLYNGYRVFLGDKAAGAWR